MTTIANTILAQLGGKRFLAMTGAKNLMDTGKGLQFDLPRGAKNKANKVRVTLTDRDDYTVEFFNLRGLDFKTVGTTEGVYCDNLRTVFTGATGLHCTL